MPTPTFKRVTLDQFEQILASFPFTRQITGVHMHHTWRPERKDFRGHETIVGMWRYHTQHNNWSDIAQHITIDPEGFIWLGRNWNSPPASAKGYNGNAKFGPFMFEMIGNFDRGHDPFDGPQRETALRVIALVQAQFGLDTNTLKFHNAMSDKSCPGNGLDYTQILEEVEQRKASVSSSRQRSLEIQSNPFPNEVDMSVREAIELLSRAVSDIAEPADAELSHYEQGCELDEALAAQGTRGAERSLWLSASAIAAMRPHLINTSQGRFSGNGRITTSPEDVDAIFQEDLPRALAQAVAERRKLRLLFFAHGGLVSESSGLKIAAKHMSWWEKNKVYPIYFIWQTGLFETLGSKLRQALLGATRGPTSDWTDQKMEAMAIALKAYLIWSGMKSSAEHGIDASTPGNPVGGATRYVAMRLKEFCERYKDNVELHAVGHSAGSIFHSYFLSLAQELGIPTFESVQFLAPAIRVDTFKELMGNRIGEGKAARKMTIYTMRKDFELDDHCAHLYRKSLLYLIHYALEDKRATPILGLEKSLRSDQDLKQLFGLAGAPSELGEVIWSKTDSDTGASASQSTTHGGFDDDAPTMNSLVRRILGLADADKITDYPKQRDAASKQWEEEIDWPEGFDTPLQLGGVQQTTPISPAPWPSYPATATFAPAYASVGPSKARRRALCVGIDRYPDPRNELAGCVADARMWADALSRLGFSVVLLTDQQATREEIQRRLTELVENSQAGDVIVFQYSGHGTTLPDLNGDEADGRDEALCPVDFASGAFYIDDDISEVFGRLASGVNLTCFMDCCHSGTNSRVAIGAPDDSPRPGKDERKRYLPATTQMVSAHKQFRERMGRGRSGVGTGGISRMRDVKFAACLDSEVAWESEGHGEFTLRATRILASGIDGMTNEEFKKRVIAAFGTDTRQHPWLDCGPGAGDLPLLQPLSANVAGASSAIPGKAGMQGSIW